MQNRTRRIVVISMLIMTVGLAAAAIVIGLRLGQTIAPPDAAAESCTCVANSLSCPSDKPVVKPPDSSCQNQSGMRRCCSPPPAPPPPPPPPPPVCSPGQWDNCGTHGCGSGSSAQCNSGGTGWGCVSNPGTCNAPPPPGPPPPPPPPTNLHPCGSTCGSNGACNSGLTCKNTKCVLTTCATNPGACSSNLCTLIGNSCNTVCGGTKGSCAAGLQCVDPNNNFALVTTGAGVCRSAGCYASTSCSCAPLPRTALVSDDTDRIIVAVILLALGIYLYMYRGKVLRRD